MSMCKCTDTFRVKGIGYTDHHCPRHGLSWRITDSSADFAGEAVAEYLALIGEVVR